MPNEPITAPGPITINGALAFTAGDPVPRETAEKLGISRGRKVEGPITATADATGITSSSANDQADAPAKKDS